MRRSLSLLEASHEVPNGRGTDLTGAQTPHAHRAPLRGAREKVDWPVRPERARACDGGNSAGPHDNAESPDCRHEAHLQPHPGVSRVATALWQSTCRRCSNRDARIVVESAAAATSSGKCKRPRREYKMGEPLRG